MSTGKLLTLLLQIGQGLQPESTEQNRYSPIRIAPALATLQFENVPGMRCDCRASHSWQPSSKTLSIQHITAMLHCSTYIQLNTQPHMSVLCPSPACTSLMQAEGQRVSSPVELHQGQGSLPKPSQCGHGAGFAFCSMCKRCFRSLLPSNSCHQELKTASLENTLITFVTFQVSSKCFEAFCNCSASEY